MIGTTLPNNKQSYRRLLWDRDTVAGCGHQLFHPERHLAGAGGSTSTRGSRSFFYIANLAHVASSAARSRRCTSAPRIPGPAGPSTNRRGVCSAVRTSHNDVPCNLGTTSGSAQAQRRRRRGPRSSAAPRAASLSQRTRLSVNSRPHSHIHRRHIKRSRHVFVGIARGVPT